jgi:tRNA-specific 2-thiouridylase
MVKKVYVGMSGGVDSSVAAALLVEQGYDVTGVFMKNWAQDLPGFKCPWREDLADAKRVAVQLGISFKIFDFQKEYKQKVVDYMIEEYQAGRTPNPDIMCNQEVKFKLFLETALDDGADMIATGHYAQIGKNTKSEILNAKQASESRHSLIGENSVDTSEPSESTKLPTTNYQLQTAVDTNKDQTYFLYRMTEAALARTLFPLGAMTKPEVRKLAEQKGLITARKKDSVGICFVGEIGIKEFLQNFVEAEPGDIIDKATKKVVGRHEGAIFYTIGQRHGLNVGGGMPYYVVGKDMEKNEVYVTTDLNDSGLWQHSFQLIHAHWINHQDFNNQRTQLKVRTRHRAQLTQCVVEEKNGVFVVDLQDEIRALAPGQSAVFYDGEVCLGGGVIA